MNLSRLALVAIATARLTRFITTDHLGEWWIVGPLKRWAWRREHQGYLSANCDQEGWYEEQEERRRATIEHDPVPTPPTRRGAWRSKLVKGLDCPFCVGFWIGALVLLGEVATHRWRPLRAVWTFALGALGLNYAVGHVSSRID